MSHTDAQLEELGRLLHDLPAENGGMVLSDFDGFVAGLLVCPEMIMPSEWLPVVWGDDPTGPNFDSLDQAQDTINAVMLHYNRVAKVLARSEPEYEAILSTDPNSGETLWEDWISGFERAMRLRPEVWGATLDSEDEEVRASLPMILALHEINVGTSQLDDAAIDELDEVAPGLIPGMVLALNSWAKSQDSLFSWRRRGRRTSLGPKVGRNEPCPCGSGKKFKKCCGSVTLH